MLVKGFCNIQNVKAIYNLLNGILIENQMKKGRRKKKRSNAANLFFEQKEEFIYGPGIA